MVSKKRVVLGDPVPAAEKASAAPKPPVAGDTSAVTLLMGLRSPADEAKARAAPLLPLRPFNETLLDEDSVVPQLFELLGEALRRPAELERVELCMRAAGCDAKFQGMTLPVPDAVQRFLASAAKLVRSSGRRILIYAGDLLAVFSPVRPDMPYAVPNTKSLKTSGFMDDTNVFVTLDAVLRYAGRPMGLLEQVVRGQLFEASQLLPEIYPRYRVDWALRSGANSRARTKTFFKGPYGASCCERILLSRSRNDMDAVLRVRDMLGFAWKDLCLVTKFDIRANAIGVLEGSFSRLVRMPKVAKLLVGGIACLTALTDNIKAKGLQAEAMQAVAAVRARDGDVTANALEMVQRELATQKYSHNIAPATTLKPILKPKEASPPTATSRDPALAPTVSIGRPFSSMQSGQAITPSNKRSGPADPTKAEVPVKPAHPPVARAPVPPGGIQMRANGPISPFALSLSPTPVWLDSLAHTSFNFPPASPLSLPCNSTWALLSSSAMAGYKLPFQAAKKQRTASHCGGNAAIDMAALASMEALEAMVAAWGVEEPGAGRFTAEVSASDRRIAV